MPHGAIRELISSGSHNPVAYNGSTLLSIRSRGRMPATGNVDRDWAVSGNAHIHGFGGLPTAHGRRPALPAGRVALHECQGKDRQLSGQLPRERRIEIRTSRNQRSTLLVLGRNARLIRMCTSAVGYQFAFSPPLAQHWSAWTRSTTCASARSRPAPFPRHFALVIAASSHGSVPPRKSRTARGASNTSRTARIPRNAQAIGLAGLPIAGTRRRISLLPLRFVVVTVPDGESNQKRDSLHCFALHEHQIHELHLGTPHRVISAGLPVVGVVARAAAVPHQRTGVNATFLAEE